MTAASETPMLENNSLEDSTIAADSEPKNVVHRFIHNRDIVVAVVDANLPTCEALSLLFRLEGYRTRFFNSLHELYRHMEKESPDVLVVAMPLLMERDISRTVRELRSPSGRCLVLLTEEGHGLPDVVEAMRAGAAAVVERPIDKETLLQIVGDELHRKIRYDMRPDGNVHVTIAGIDHLSRREKEVVSHILDGLSNKEIGRRLAISPRTVEVHRATAMRKLGARNTAELVKFVLMS